MRRLLEIHSVEAHCTTGYCRGTEAVGIRAVLLHAMSDEAKRFYIHHGFAESPVDPMTMMVLLADVERAVRP